MARETRADDIAVIADLLGCDHQTPRRRKEAIDRAFTRFGWEMLSDEALQALADRLEADQRFAGRLTAENRALNEAAAERAAIRAAHATGDLLAEAFPIPSSQKDAA